MKCPRHQTDLKRHLINNHEVYKCPECEGLWVPGPVIDNLLGAGQMLQLRSLCSVRESDLHCPSGCGKLHEGKIGPVTLDLCQDCGGLWLDPGELEILRQRKGITPHQSVESNVEVTHGVSASSELLLYGLMMFS